MNDEWLGFAHEMTATGTLPARIEGAGFCALVDEGLLRISGADAESFLQGQATCDVAALVPGMSTLGAFCNPKGRVIASFRLLRTDTAFYLALPAELATRIRDRLKIYVLRSKVAIENLSDSWALVGLYGNGLHPSLAAAGISMPETLGHGRAGESWLALNVDEIPGRALLAADTASATRLWRHLQDTGAGRPIDPSVWRLMEIEAGVPRLCATTSEEFLPQMLNLDLLGGVSFKKGCYTGQEVVTRTHFLGQVKRRMFRLRCCAPEAALAPGTVVYGAASADAAPVGQIVTACPDPDGTLQVLAVVAIDQVSSGHLHVVGPGGPQAEVLALPYTFP